MYTVSNAYNGNRKVVGTAPNYLPINFESALAQESTVLVQRDDDGNLVLMEKCDQPTILFDPSRITNLILGIFVCYNVPVSVKISRLSNLGSFT